MFSPNVKNAFILFIYLMDYIQKLTQKFSGN